MAIEQYRFADFRLDPRRKRLFRNERLVPLTSKCAAILCELVRNAGSLVNRDMLAASVWGDATGVSDATINQHVAMLRRALSKDGPSDFIATHSGIGYCFVEPVLSVEQSSAAQMAEALCDNARYFLSLRSERALQSAVHFYTQASSVDPGSARAYAGKAECLAIIADSAYAAAPGPLLEALDLARKALELDPLCAPAYFARAKALHDLTYAREIADELLARSIELAPAHEIAHSMRPMVHALNTDFERAEFHAKEGLEALPDSYLMRSVLPAVHVFARRYDAAIPLLESLLAKRPHYWSAQLLLGIAHYMNGRTDAAIALWESVRTTELDHELLIQPNVRPRAYGYLLYAYASLGRRHEYDMLHAQLEQLREFRFVPPLCSAFANLGLGRFDLAEADIRRSFAIRDPWTAYILVEPFFDALRGRAEFDSVAQHVRTGAELPEMGLP